MKVQTGAWLLAGLLIGCGGGTGANAGAKSPGGGEEPVVGDEAASAPAGPELRRATDLLEAGDAAGAKRELDTLVAKDPKSAPAHYYLGVATEKIGQRGDAAAHYGRALAIDPKLEEAAVNLSALHLDAQKYDEALRVVRAALAHHGKSSSLRLNEGLALAATGRSAEAIAAMEQAAQLAPGSAMVLLTLGQALGQAKRRDEAIARLEAAGRAAGDDRGMLASAAFELKGLGAFAPCTALLDKAIGLKDAAELRTYRALCRLGASDKGGARADLEAAIKAEPDYAPAHFYLGGRLAEAGEWGAAESAYRQYLKLEPSGPLAKAADERAKLAAANAKGKAKAKGNTRGR